METEQVKQFRARLGRRLGARERAGEFSGVVLVRQGETDWFRRSYGYASRPWRVRNHPRMRFRIASIGKMFTAVATLQLIEAGQLTLETRVVDALGLSGTRIPREASVAHLLTMTSGMADWVDENSPDWEAIWAEFCRKFPVYLLRRNQDYLPFFEHAEPLSALGERHSYCGAGFILLGMLIEQISGKSYFDVVRERVFAPAGMARSDFLALDDLDEDVAEGYVPVTGAGGERMGWKKNIYSTTAAAAADGGASASADDLVSFARALRAGRLLSPQWSAEMLRPRVAAGDARPDGRRVMYGYGCFVSVDGAGAVLRWGHTGEEDGASCRLYYYPRADLDVAVMGNLSGCAGSVMAEIDALIE